MRLLSSLLALPLSFSLFCSAAFAADTAASSGPATGASGVNPASPVTPAPSAAHLLAIAGDSTVSDYPLDRPDRGWGQVLPAYFDPAEVRIANFAIPGRSTKTFRSQGDWQKLLAAKPELVLIQFGHNDSHDKTKPEATDAGTEYRENLRRFVDEAQTAGVKVVLVTPMHRRTFHSDGTLFDILAPYATVMKEVAAEKHVPVIDLFSMSGELYLQLGPEKCLELANKPGDQTHFGEKGARAMAELIMTQFPSAVPSWTAWIRSSR